MNYIKPGVKMSINVLVLSGEGINCETETANAFELAGAQTTQVHLTDFLELDDLNQFDILAFPGGFSYGDEIRSGKILAEKIRLKQYDNLIKFVEAKKPIIGICNGFQILTQLGLFNEVAPITLSHNNHDKFIDLWVELKLANNNSLWLKDLPETLLMPVRHKEGRISGDFASDQMALNYQQDINGSRMMCAGLTNKDGNVLGLMPHPEAAIKEFLLPHSFEKANHNLQIFKNAVEYAKRIKQ